MTITNQHLKPLGESKYLKPARLCFTRDGVQKEWEIIQAHDSVAILLYHQDNHSFILVHQFRPAVSMRHPEGFTYELCAGLVDKQLDELTIAKEEIFEECGFDVPKTQIQRITSFHTAVGFAGSKQTLFYAEIDESMRTHEGGGVEGEIIDVVEMPIADARTFMFDESKVKTPGLMFAFLWWFDRHPQNKP